MISLQCGSVLRPGKTRTNDDDCRQPDGPICCHSCRWPDRPRARSASERHSARRPPRFHRRRQSQAWCPVCLQQLKLLRRQGVDAMPSHQIDANKLRIKQRSITPVRVKPWAADCASLRRTGPQGCSRGGSCRNSAASARGACLCLPKTPAPAGSNPESRASWQPQGCAAHRVENPIS